MHADPGEGRVPACLGSLWPQHSGCVLSVAQKCCKTHKHFDEEGLFQNKESVPHVELVVLNPNAGGPPEGRTPTRPAAFQKKNPFVVIRFVFLVSRKIVYSASLLPLNVGAQAERWTPPAVRAHRVQG